MEVVKMKCTATTKSGNPCKNDPKHGEVLCGPHFDRAEAAYAKWANRRRWMEEAVKAEEEEEAKLATTELSIVGGTGSRELQLADGTVKKAVYDWLVKQLTMSADKHGDKLRVMSGMAEGFDALLAYTAMQLDIPFIAAVPNEGYGRYYWGPKNNAGNGGSITGTDRLDVFESYLKAAELVVYVKEEVHGITDSGVFLDVKNKTASWDRGKGLVNANFVRNDFMARYPGVKGFFVYDENSSGTSHCVGLLKQFGVLYKVFKA
jgi:hypothetical protein